MAGSGAHSVDTSHYHHHHQDSAAAAASVSFNFSEFQALVGRKVNVAGSWFEGDFGTENAGSFFQGEIKKAARATKKLPMRIEVKFITGTEMYIV